jgi:hypothetical protein
MVKIYQLVFERCNNRVFRSENKYKIKVNVK